MSDSFIIFMGNCCSSDEGIQKPSLPLTMVTRDLSTNVGESFQQVRQESVSITHEKEIDPLEEIKQCN